MTMTNDYLMWAERPWGRWALVARGEGYATKIIEVEPGHALSLQTHDKRVEIWTVLDGSPTFTIGSVSLTGIPYDVYAVGIKTPHRITNNTNRLVRILESIVGDYDEADIIRLEDRYSR